MSDKAKISSRNLNFYYSDFHALQDISFDMYQHQATALIGPSGCGKSTFLRCINRMNDLIDGIRVEGALTMDGQDLNDPRHDVVVLRRRVGMVFQKPNPFPKSIYENVAYGLRVNGVRDRDFIDARVEESLKLAALWEEVKDRLDQSGLSLSGGQQQRCASPGPWPWNPRCCSWTSLPRLSTPSRPRRSKNSFMISRTNSPSSS
jgi:phosphate transport system ATP-binding protein